MITSFVRNDNNAKALGASANINKTGAYSVNIVQAQVRENGKTQFLVLTMKAADGATTNSSIFLTKKDGSEAWGRKLLDALMVLGNVQNCAVQQGAVWVRDAQTQGGYRKEAGYRIPAIELKNIGVLLQRYNRVYGDKVVFDMNVIDFFRLEDRKNAKEILENSEASIIDARLKTLKDRDSEEVKQMNSGYGNAAAKTEPMLDDSIPF